MSDRGLMTGAIEDVGPVIDGEVVKDSLTVRAGGAGAMSHPPVKPEDDGVGAISRDAVWYAGAIKARWRDATAEILAAAELMAEARERLAHGEWLAMVDDHLPFGRRKAQMLAAIGADSRLHDAQRVAHLPPSWAAMYDISRLDDAALDARIADGTIRPDMERREIAQVVKREQRARREMHLGARIEALPDARYGVIVADPEWRFEVRSRATGMDRAADNHYPTSPTEVISARPVADIAADDCVLFLWATTPMLPQALQVMEAWGFGYVSHLVWSKRERPGAKPMQGTGYWVRCSHELLLIGTRGNVPAPAPGDQPASTIDAPALRHSQKPEVFLDMIERLYPHVPKIELNRRGPARPGWHAWGNEATEPRAKASDEAKPEAGAVEGVSRSAGARSPAATAEMMAVTARRDGRGGGGSPSSPSALHEGAMDPPVKPEDDGGYPNDAGSPQPGSSDEAAPDGGAQPGRSKP